MSAPSRGPGEALAASVSGLYRRLWRWHFYAGLICLPFIVSLAVTGALYLFHKQIDDLVYGAAMLRAPATATLAGSAPALVPSRLVAAALAAHPGQALAYTTPADSAHNAQVDVLQGASTLQVFVDPVSARVAGSIDEASRIMTIIKHVHSLTVVGTAGQIVIEIVAGWIIVLVSTGIYLWWPRGRRVGVVTIRAGARGRAWWRDLHAVTGAFGGVIILFLALSGMPWSVFWGQNVNAWLSQHGLGVPAGMWSGVPVSTRLGGTLGQVPWSQQQAPLPASHDSRDPHAMHHGHAMAPAPSPAGAVGIDAIVASLAGLGLAADSGVRVVLPRAADGVYSAISLPGQLALQRVIHFDQYSGKLLLDIGGRDLGAVAQVTEWGVSVHQGGEYGLPNLLVMLAGCLALLTLAISGAVMWWRRRPAGALAAPPRRDGDQLARGVLAIAIVLGCVFPLLGASMLVALLVDWIVTRWTAARHKRDRKDSSIV